MHDIHQYPGLALARGNRIQIVAICSKFYVIVSKISKRYSALLIMRRILIMDKNEFAPTISFILSNILVEQWRRSLEHPTDTL